MVLSRILNKVCSVSLVAVVCFYSVDDLKAQNYLCSNGFCDLRVISGSLDTLIVFSGSSNQDYYIDLRRYVPKDGSNIDREQLRYTIQSQQQLDGTPSAFFRLNLPASNLLWTAAVAGNSYEVHLNYFEDAIMQGDESIVIRFDTSSPKFDYDVHADTIFVGTKLQGMDTTLARPINVFGADSILYRIQDTSYRSSLAGPDGIFANWLRLSDSGHVVAYDAPQRAGTYTFYTRVYKSYNGVVEDRLDASSLDSIVIVVIDTPLIVYNDVQRIIVPPNSAATSNLNTPTLDLKGVPYTFSIASVVGTANRINAPSTSYSVDPMTGVFRDEDPAFGSNVNSYIFTIRASTNRYGGKTVEKTFRYRIIDTPLVSYPAASTIFDYEHDYTGTRDSIMLPSALDWRQDTGRFHLVEVISGYRDDDNNFVEQSRTFGNRNADAALPAGIMYDADSAKISWNRYTIALEYQFKVIASNDAGISPKKGEDTARFTLVIRPGMPTISYAANSNQSTVYGQAFSSIVPVINWKGVPLSLRKDSVALIEFSGSIDPANYGTDTKQARIKGLEIVVPQNENTAGQLSLRGGNNYPPNMRAGRYRLEAFVWNANFPTQKGSGLDTIVVTPASLAGFEYRVTVSASYDHAMFWRAYSYNDASKYDLRLDVNGVPVYRFDGEDIDSGVVFNSLQSQLYTYFDNDGGDTISYRIVSIDRETASGTMAAPIFSSGFSIPDRKSGAFVWNGAADRVAGDLSTLGSAPPGDDGVRYRIVFEAMNALGSVSHAITFEVYRPTPKLLFTGSPLSTFHYIPFPISGTTVSDTTILPIEYPGMVGQDINGASWYVAPGRDAGMASYNINLSQNLINFFTVDTLTDIDRPTISFSNNLARGRYRTIDIKAVNASGTHSLTPEFGIVIIDTPRNQQYVRDTIRVNCGFELDSNYINVAESLNEDAAGWDEQNGRFGLAYSILRIDEKLPQVDHDAVSIVNAAAYSKVGESVGKVYFNGKKDDRDVFVVDTFDVWIKVTNSLTRGDIGLPERLGAYDSVLMVLVVRGMKPELSYSELDYESFFALGGSSAAPQIDWGCQEGTYRLIDTANQDIQGRLSVGLRSGVITWEKDLPTKDEYAFKVVAENPSGSDTTHHILRINIAPPSSYIYSPNTLTTSYGQGGKTHLPSINWNGNVGNFSIAPDIRGASTESSISINSLTGSITWKEDIPVGTYDLIPTATNAGGYTTTTFKLVVEQSKPSIDYLPNASTVAFGSSGKSIQPIVNKGGSSSVTHTLIPIVEGVMVNQDGTIEWSGATAVGSYTLQSVVNNGFLSDTALYTLVIEKSDVGMKKGALSVPDNAYTLFPNPIPQGGSATLRFGLSVASVVRIAIINMHGELVLDVLQKGLSPGDYDIPINVGRLVGGMYLLEIRTEQNVHRKRIIITQ